MSPQHGAGQIRLMDPHLAAKIAAGEVIERPASVVKELVENALDSGARRIRVEIAGGGIDRICVSDDGCGIPSDQLELAFRRHATSKLRQEADLDDLHTLGFRGEALPSIATIADVTCLTRTAKELVGTELRIEAGAIEIRNVPRGTPGTTLTVEHVFARFPARRKFLRARSSEAAACTQVVQPLALAFPSVQFLVLVDGREALRTPGDGQLRSAAIALLGEDVDRHLVDVAEELIGDDGVAPVVQVRGLAGTGSLHRSGRSGQFLLLNHRPIQNRTLSFALQESYGSLVPVGRYPVAVLDITVPPHEVDFNVHPSKLEVKLLRERAVYAGIQRAIRSALAEGTWELRQWDVIAPGTDVAAQPLEPTLWPAGSVSQASETSDGTLLSGGERLEQLRVVGQVGRTYVIAEGDAGMYLVDQHAAHERVMLERLREALAGRVERQLLLVPVVVEVGPEAAQLAETAREALVELGFELEPFGPRELLVRAVPALLASRQPDRVLGEALTALATHSHGLIADPHASWTERLALVLACKTAVRAGDSLAESEMQALLRQLGEAELCRTCAHGRPTAILLDFNRLEREFGRR